MIKKILFPVIFIVLNVKNTYCQASKCCNIEIDTRCFIQDSVYSFKAQYMVKNHILYPINESKADFEIRLYDVSTPTIYNAIIIKCKKGGVEAEHLTLYSASDQQSKEFEDNHYQDVSTEFHKQNHAKLWLKKQVKLSPAGKTWQEFFNILTKSELCYLPSAQKLLKIVTKKYPLSLVTESAVSVIELKIGKKMRNYDIMFSFEDEANSIKEVKDRNKLINTLYSLKDY